MMVNMVMVNNDGRNQNPNRNRCRKTYLYFLWKSFGNFLRQTGLHGLRFVDDPTITTWERCFFIAAFIGAVITTGHLVAFFYAKWQSTPVIIGISSRGTSILSVPFPAVTICKMNQLQLSKVAGYTEKSPEGELLTELCRQDGDNSYSNDLNNNFNQTYPYNNLSIFEFILSNSLPCERMLLHCRFGSVEYNCLELFSPLIIDEGLCCVFNVLPNEYLYKRSIHNYDSNRTTEKLMFTPVKWTLEKGYPNDLPRNYSPRTSAGVGTSLGLSIVLDAQLSEHYCSSSYISGFNLYFDNPIEKPSIKESALFVPIGYETNFQIDFIHSEAVDGLRYTKRKDRQCIFDNEQRLHFYQIYTQRNCENECWAKMLVESCGCIPHSQPQIYANASVCAVKDFRCIREAKNSGHSSPRLQLCRDSCLPSCFDLKYSADSFTTPLAIKNFKISHPTLANISRSYIKDNIGIVHAFYRESVYFGQVKNIYIGLTEFLSNLGGIMSLFMGFSVISVAEIIYFLILKPIVEFFLANSCGHLRHSVVPQIADEKGKSTKTKPSKIAWQ